MHPSALFFSLVARARFLTSPDHQPSIQNRPNYVKPETKALKIYSLVVLSERGWGEKKRDREEKKTLNHAAQR